MLTRRTTRAVRAAQLRAMIESGPACLRDVGDRELNRLRGKYQLWARTWIIPELDMLVPELRTAKARKKDEIPAASR